MTKHQQSLVYIQDMLDAMDKIEQFLVNVDEQTFLRDDKTIFAVIRALEIIGEVAKRIPPEVRQAYETIPWKAMAGMRDKLIHDYTVVNTTVVWKTATEDIPMVKQLLYTIRDSLRTESD
jgi:uncharacterized protein with HEPN domain